jgi:hypothetical protein
MYWGAGGELLRADNGIRRPHAVGAAFPAGAIAVQGFITGHRRRTGRPDQFGPNEVPVALPQVPSTQGLVRRRFGAARIGSTHIPAAGQALIEILLADPKGRGELLSLLRRDVPHPNSLAYR